MSSSYRKSQSKIPVKDAVIRLLHRRDHGEHEMRQKLLNKGYELKEIDMAIAYCKDKGWQSDDRYAASVIRQSVMKGHGKKRIVQELNSNKVDSHIIDMAFEQESIDWYQLAKAVFLKKFSYQESLDQKEYAKRVRFLQYRGFDFEQIRYAMEEGDNS